MKKIVLVLAMLTLAAPAWAAVTVEAANDVNVVTISYTADANRPRAFALDISVSGPNVSIGVPYDLNEEYYIYPGSISIVGGVVQVWGTPVAPGSQDANSMTLEMGSLYAPGDMNHPDPPPLFGVLCKFTVDGNDCEENFFVTIEENAERGGVVMEDPDEDPDLTLTGCELKLPDDMCGCPCLGDIASSNALPPPDGQVDLGDFTAMSMALMGVGPPYVISPIPPGLECGDVASSNALPPPDGQVDLGDFTAMSMYLMGVGPPYVAPCMP